MRPEPSKPVIRETTCKTILNKSKLGDYSLNCYGGCAHGCAYCYARYMERFHPHEEPWGAFVDVKVNAVEVLERQLRSAKPGSVFVSSACDGWQPVERERELTRNCCRLLIEHGFRPNCLTKNALILRDLDILAGHDARVAVTITTLDPAAAALWEAHASPVEERFGVLREAHAAGLETGIMFGPVLPFLSDDQTSIDAFFERAAEVKVDVIWVDTLNARPNVWPSVKDLLERRHAELVERYHRVLYWDKVRAAYRQGLRERVLRAAERYHLENRVCVVST